MSSFWKDKHFGEIVKSGNVFFLVVSIDVLSVSIRFSIRFCIYEHIKNYVFTSSFENNEFSKL